MPTTNCKTAKNLLNQIKSLKKDLDLELANIKKAKDPIEQYQAVTKAKEVKKDIQEKLTNLKEILDPLKNREYIEAKERFGENFLGVEEIESAFTLKDKETKEQTRLVELSPIERRQAFKLLKEKLKEPDIIEFLKYLEQNPEEKDNYQLILRTSTFNDNTPITMQSLNQKISRDMKEQDQGKLLYATDRYKDELFYTTDTPITKDNQTLSWQIQVKNTVEGTKSENHTDQTEILNQKAKEINLDPDKIHRRTPVQVIYDYIINLRARDTRILENEYDWTGTKASSGRLVDVGRCGARGALVDGRKSSDSSSIDGASFSR